MTPEHLSPLSPRQKDVLMLLSIGRPMKGVALTLGIEYSTTKTHAMCARLKLGATTNEHAIAIAVRNGWI